LDRSRGGSTTGASTIPPLHPAEAISGDAGKPPTRTDMTVAFAHKLSEALLAHDAQAAGALFAQDAVSTVVGDPEDARGRAAIEEELRRVLDRYTDTRLTVGRVWVGASASAIEFVLVGTRPAGKLMRIAAPARQLGLVGASVVAFQA